MSYLPGPDQSSKLLEVSSCPQFIWETVPDVGGLISKRFPTVRLCVYSRKLSKILVSERVICVFKFLLSQEYNLVTDY